MKFIEKEMKKWKSLEEITKELVKKSIKWKRKGMTYTNNYGHSFNVYDLLVKDWYDEDICIAWLLHDIIEDWWHTEQQLLDLWYNARVVSLVVACSHNPSIEDSYKRRENMMKKIKESKNEDALIIKIADFTDNLQTAHLLKEDKSQTFVLKKGPYLMDLKNNILWDNKYFNQSNINNLFYDRWIDAKLLSTQ